MRAPNEDRSDAPRVDVHHHMIPPGYREILNRSGHSAVSIPSWTPSDSLGWMEDRGIDRAILSLPEPGVWFGDETEARSLARRYNEFGAELMREHPDHFGALATLPFPGMDACCEEIAYSLDELGLSGIQLLTNVDGHYVGDTEFDPLMAELDHRQAQVLLHPNHPRSGSQDEALYPWAELPLDVTRVYARLIYNDVLVRFPGIRWVLAHAGGGVPFLAGRLGKAHYARPGAGPTGGGLRWGRILRDLALKRNGGLDLARNVSYETAGFEDPVARAALDELVGPDRILFGSNYPWPQEAPR